MSEQLVRDLLELGRTVPTPEAPMLEARVLARLGEPGEPAPSSHRLRALLEGSRARLAAAVVAVLLVLLAVPPVRAAVSDWFGFGSVVVHRGDDEARPPGPVSPPPIPPGPSLADAAAQVDFVVLELAELGEPQGAEVSRDRRVLSLAWTGGIRLDQSSSLGYTFDKTAPRVDRVSVDGQEALWFRDSHDLVLVDEDGRRRQGTGRPAARTLVWTVGDTTLRLEGATLTLGRAIEIAESTQPLD